MRRAGGEPAGLAADEWRTFGGNWTATGTRTTLDLGSDHRASIVHMNGSLVLAGENRPGVGFKAEIVGFTDSQRGMVGRSVWTDERGDKVFSELTGEWVGTGNRIAGTFLGGTGRYAGATGEYRVPVAVRAHRRRRYRQRPNGGPQGAGACGRHACVTPVGRVTRGNDLP